MFSQYGSILLKVLGVVVIVAGAINIKDFFYFKERGVSYDIRREPEQDIPAGREDSKEGWTR